jgi:hypothetical protein
MFNTIVVVCCQSWQYDFVAMFTVVEISATATSVSIARGGMCNDL